MYHYILSPKAQEEFETSIEWYYERDEKVAIKFTESISKTIDLICKQPYLFKTIFGDFHEVSTNKYPFIIIYAIEEEIKTIIIISIFHHKRNPKKKYK
jgi:plasmid stabilization system protein ParE